MEQRIIGGYLYRRRPAADRVTGQSYFAVEEFRLVSQGANLVGNPALGPDPELIDASAWTPARAWDKGPGERFNAMLAGVRMGEAIPRVATPVELEIRALRAEGKAHMADILEAAHPPAPPEMIKPDGALFEVNADEVKIGFQGHRLLVISPPEIRNWLTRHALGDGGELGSFRKEDVTWTADSVFFPSLCGAAYESEASVTTGSGLVRSRFSAWRPDVDGSDDECVVDPRYTGTIHARKRNRDDWAEVLTLLVPGLPPRTIIYTNKDIIGSRIG